MVLLELDELGEIHNVLTSDADDVTVLLKALRLLATALVEQMIAAATPMPPIPPI